jgi:predicted nucleic acid-binding protein
VRVVLDLNVALDVLLARDEFLESTEILLLASARKIEAIMPLHGITTVFYFCRKQKSEIAARNQISALLESVHIFSISQEDVAKAIHSPVRDFEDAIVAETARISDADYILTRDISDFRESFVPAITPTQFLEMFFRERN